MTTLGMRFTRKTKTRAFGHVEGARRKTGIGFDPALFEQISDLAQRNKISFSEQVIRICAAAIKRRAS